MNLDGLNFPNFKNPKCGETDPDIFFPESKQELKNILPTLQEICGGCEHRLPCLEYALVNDIKDGVWGGVTPNQRFKMKPDQGTHSQAYRDINRKLEQGWTIPAIAKARGTTLQAVYRVLARAGRKIK